MTASETAGLTTIRRARNWPKEIHGWALDAARRAGREPVTLEECMWLQNE